MKSIIKDNLKNLLGWRTKRKLIVFAVDDYGNVRLNSIKAATKINQAFPIIGQRFDQYDALETKQDLEQLYSVLQVVKDKDGNPAKFTPYVLTHNMNFEVMEKSKWQFCISEIVTETFGKLALSQPKAYDGTWEMWLSGIDQGLICPQFHGREHYNLSIIREKLDTKDSRLLSSIQNYSLANLDISNYSATGWSTAFSFCKKEEIKDLKDILVSGIESFEKIYGYKSEVFTAPGMQFPKELENILPSLGFIAFDRPLYENRRLVNGQNRWQLNFTGKKIIPGLISIIRNVVFEPNINNFDHVAKAIKQIEAAFRWNKPAIISSHRVNFSGHIDPNNRTHGLQELKRLLQTITKKWPDVEFISANELANIITRNKTKSN